MRKLLIGTMCLMMVVFLGSALAQPRQGGETCASATIVPTIPYTDSGVMGQTDDCAGTPYFDVFYVLTAPVAGSYTFDMCNSYGDSYFRIWTGGTCCSGAYVAGDDECGGMDPLRTVTLTLNQVVYIKCGSYYSTGYAGQAYNFHIAGPPVPTPGDNCANPKPIVLPAQIPYSDLAQHTCGRINDYSGTTCLGYYDGGEDIIYEVNVTAAVTVDISLNTATSYVGMCIANSCPPGATCIALSTNGGTGWQYMNNVALTPGTYWIMVDTWPSPTCIPSFDLYIVLSPPPPMPYYWANNCNQGTGVCHPLYNWVDVTTNSVICGPSYTPQDGILGDDDWEGPFPIGFTFNYYGTDYTTFTICSNGFLMLGNTGNTNYGNVCIPASAAPNGMLAWFWDDLDGGSGTPSVYWGNGVADGHHSLIVTFVDFMLFGSSYGITAQVILKDNNEHQIPIPHFPIRFCYQ